MQVATYEVTDPTVDSQMIQLKNSGANVFFNITTPKFAAQAIKKAAEIGWKPAHYLNNVSSSVGAVMKPAGFEASARASSRPPTSRTRPTRSGRRHADMVAWNAFMDKYYAAAATRTSTFHAYGYAVSATLVEVLKQCRRQPHARERHEAGREPEGRRDPAAAAGHQDQHQRDRLLSDPVGAAGRASRARPSSCSATSCPARPNSSCASRPPVPQTAGSAPFTNRPSGIPCPVGFCALRWRLTVQ